MPDAVSIISAKRDGRVLDDEQIEWVIAEFTRGSVAPEQMSALAMASSVVVVPAAFSILN